MKVLKDRILVSVLDNTELVKNDLGLTLPNQSVNEGIDKAEVIEVGKDVEDVKPGDKCFIYSGAGKEFTNPGDNKKYKLITVSEVVVIF